jgi:pimeloyl-ACP methyl ester carboxylesterase
VLEDIHLTDMLARNAQFSTTILSSLRENSQLNNFPYYQKHSHILFIPAIASDTKPTIFIVHGGWHVPKSYKRLTGALESQGYEIHLPRLPSTNGSWPPNFDLYADSLLVRNYVGSLVTAGRTLVVIMHSYGGQVGTNALHGLGLEALRKRGLPGGISHLIYVTAYAVPEGSAIWIKSMNLTTWISC